MGVRLAEARLGGLNPRASRRAITACEARKRFATVIETVQREAVFVERRGETEAVMISAAEYNRLMEAAEETEDMAAFDAAMAEEGPNIPMGAGQGRPRVVTRVRGL